MSPPTPHDSRSRDGRALFRYATAWLVGGLLVAAAVVNLLGPEETVRVPPVQHTQLDQAAADAGCELRRAQGGERVNPTVSGERYAAPLAPGVYEEAGDERSIVAALRRGTIVVQYRPDLDSGAVDELDDLHEAAPNGTIVIPNGTGMGYAFAATAWKRILGCDEVSDDALEAARLFSGRFVGQGPDQP